MALVDFPDNLNEIMAPGFTFEPKGRNFILETQSGVSRPRTFAAGDVYILTGQFVFAQQRYDDFEKFLKQTISYGDDWFQADWFVALGFAVDTFAFRFISIEEDNAAYKSTYNVTLLMMLAADAPQPGDAWPDSALDVGFLDQRFGCISPSSPVVAGISTTVFDLKVGEVARAFWKTDWVIDFYDLETGDVDTGPHTILSVSGDRVTLTAPAAGTPDNTLGIRFSEYDNVDDSQKKYAFISDGVSDFPSDGGKAYRIMFG